MYEACGEGRVRGVRRRLSPTMGDPRLCDGEGIGYPGISYGRCLPQPGLCHEARYRAVAVARLQRPAATLCTLVPTAGNDAVSPAASLGLKPFSATW